MQLSNKIILPYILIFSCFSATADNTALEVGKSAVCIACHGPTGIGSGPLKPNLASQDADYIVHQLKAFRSGVRKSIIMNSISKSLTDKEIIALAEFYSSQPFAGIKELGDPVLIKKGADKYSSCWTCHGEQGEGPGSYPSIAGQHPQYTVQQLLYFKDGSRINPVMKTLVDTLSIDDMKALGAYIATLSY